MKKDITLLSAVPEDADLIYELVQNTIKTIYPKYYPAEVVEFFCRLHNKSNILKDIAGGCVSVLLADNRMVGTGSYEGNHITRVYVAPEFQGQGYGGYMMQYLETEITRQHNSVELDASLPAGHFYEERGYRTVRHERVMVENEAVLVYEVMEKQLP